MLMCINYGESPLVRAHRERLRRAAGSNAGHSQWLADVCKNLLRAGFLKNNLSSQETLEKKLKAKKGYRRDCLLIAYAEETFAGKSSKSLKNLELHLGDSSTAH